MNVKHALLLLSLIETVSKFQDQALMNPDSADCAHNARQAVQQLRQHVENLKVQ